MRYLRRITFFCRSCLGSARVSRVWRWRPRHRELFGMRQRVVLIAGRAFRRRHRNVHARARALPRAPRSFVISAGIVLATAMAIVGWLPIPDQLHKSPAGTLTLLDCRSREIAELASPEARAQLPITLDQMGPWLPRLTVALEDRRVFKKPRNDWDAHLAALPRHLLLPHVVSRATALP